MGFRSLLAKRYIFEQKRHSVLTICSIVAALTLMTMLFTFFSTTTACLRNYAYEKAPYHIMIPSVTREQGNAIAKVDGIESCTLVQNKMMGGMFAYIFFEKGLKDEETVLRKAFEKAELGFTIYDEGEYVRNDSLMQWDFVGVDTWANFASIFAMFYIFVIFLAVAMRLVIDTAFEISSKERERQYGVLQSIGATPKQVVGIITTESSMLSVIGVPIGMLCGTGLAYIAYCIVRASGLTSVFFNAQKAEKIMEFNVSPLMLAAAALTGFFWVWLSAYSTGMRIVKMSPMQAISGRSSVVKKVKKHRLIGLLFGWKGKLAARNVRRAPKRFIITVLSLALSITLIASFDYVIDGVNNTYQNLFEDLGFMRDFSAMAEFYNDSFEDVEEQIQKLERSGYFEDISVQCSGVGRTKDESTGKLPPLTVEYVNEEGYLMRFRDDPPIPYEEFLKMDGYMHITPSEDAKEIAPELFEDWSLYEQDSYDGTLRCYVHVSLEEYETLTEEEKKKLIPEVKINQRTGEETLLGYRNATTTEHHFPVAYRTPDTAWTDTQGLFEGVELYAPIERYAEQDHVYYGDSLSGAQLEMNLKEGAEYRDAVKFLESSADMELWYDIYGDKKAFESVLSLVNIIGRFIMAMVAVIALVNMINIISTGLLNRRAELATMQCVGMTERQLLGMGIVECLQYILTAAISAFFVCLALLLGTELFEYSIMAAADPELPKFEPELHLTEPVLVILLCAVVGFVIALTTTIVSLNGMKKQALVEQIRSVD